MLDTMAALYEEITGPTGIPWDRLVAEGHDLREGYDAAYMDILLQESFKFFTVIGKMSESFRTKYRTIQDTEARKAVTQLMALINQTGTDIWQAVKDGDLSAMVHFPTTVAEDSFATLAASAANGAYLHFDGVMESAMLAGKITADDVMAHADAVMKTFQTFVDLDQNGHFADLRPQATSGLGIAPIVIGGWALASLGIVLVLGLCYCYYVYRAAGPIQDKLAEWCDQLTKNPNSTSDDLRTCISAAESVAKNGNANLGNFLGGLVQPLGVVLAVGAALYIGSLILPGILMKKAATA